MKITKKKPICKFCYDKKFFTVFQGEYSYSDFGALKRYETLPDVKNIRCSVCKGRPRVYIRKYIKAMLISVRNDGFITPVLERIMELL